MNSYDNLLISIEGIDGSGTTTLCENLQDELSDEWEFSQEPSQGAYGRIMREVLQSDDDPSLSDFFLFCADRVDHIESLIGPKMEDETVEGVVLDRYNLSTYAYQSPIVRDGIYSRSGIDYINSVVSEWVIVPDLTIVLDVSVEQAFERMDEEREIYEKEDRLKEARKIYHSFAETNDYVVLIDGTQSEEKVLEEALEKIDECRN